MIWDVVVLGAGAAGLMAAATAGQGGARVLVLDHGPEPGRKILISGGGAATSRTWTPARTVFCPRTVTSHAQRWPVIRPRTFWSL